MTSKNVPATPENTDVVVSHRITDAQYAQVKTFEDAAALIQDVLGGVLEDFAEYGSGLDLASESALVGVPFIIMEFTFHKSDKFLAADGSPAEFVSVAVVTQDNRKIVFNDGSTGVCEQLKSVRAARESRGMSGSGVMQGLICRKGLRASNYRTEKGEAATTYYLA